MVIGPLSFPCFWNFILQLWRVARFSLEAGGGQWVFRDSLQTQGPCCRAGSSWDCQTGRCSWLQSLYIYTENSLQAPALVLQSGPVCSESNNRLVNVVSRQTAVIKTTRKAAIKTLTVILWCEMIKICKVCIEYSNYWTDLASSDNILLLFIWI